MGNHCATCAAAVSGRLSDGDGVAVHAKVDCEDNADFQRSWVDGEPVLPKTRDLLLREDGEPILPETPETAESIISQADSNHEESVRWGGSMASEADPWATRLHEKKKEWLKEVYKKVTEERAAAAKAAADQVLAEAEARRAMEEAEEQRRIKEIQELEESKKAAEQMEERRKEELAKKRRVAAAAAEKRRAENLAKEKAESAAQAESKENHSQHNKTLDADEETQKGLEVAKQSHDDSMIAKQSMKKFGYKSKEDAMQAVTDMLKVAEKNKKDLLQMRKDLQKKHTNMLAVLGGQEERMWDMFGSIVQKYKYDKLMIWASITSLGKFAAEDKEIYTKLAKLMAIIPLGENEHTLKQAMDSKVELP